MTRSAELQTSVEGKSRSEIIRILQRGGYELDFEIRLNARFINAEVYENGQEANRVRNIPARSKIPFVAILYGSQVAQFNFREFDSFIEGGRLYEFCKEKDIPVEEFYLRASEFSSREKAMYVRAIKTLSRMKKQVMGAKK